MIDNTGQNCDSCDSGHYAESSVQDDIQGVLHCNECGKCVPRWIPDEE